MPPELWGIIVNHMNEGDLLYFALACKNFYYYVKIVARRKLRTEFITSEDSASRIIQLLNFEKTTGILSLTYESLWKIAMSYNWVNIFDKLYQIQKDIGSISLYNTHYYNCKIIAYALNEKNVCFMKWGLENDVIPDKLLIEKLQESFRYKYSHIEIHKFLKELIDMNIITSTNFLRRYNFLNWQCCQNYFDEGSFYLVFRKCNYKIDFMDYKMLLYQSAQTCRKRKKCFQCSGRKSNYICYGEIYCRDCLFFSDILSGQQECLRTMDIYRNNFFVGI